MLPILTAVAMLLATSSVMELIIVPGTVPIMWSYFLPATKYVGNALRRAARDDPFAYIFTKLLEISSFVSMHEDVASDSNGTQFDPCGDMSFLNGTTGNSSSHFPSTPDHPMINAHTDLILRLMIMLTIFAIASFSVLLDYSRRSLAVPESSLSRAPGIGDGVFANFARAGQRFFGITPQPYCISRDTTPHRYRQNPALILRIRASERKRSIVGHGIKDHRRRLDTVKSLKSLAFVHKANMEHSRFIAGVTKKLSVHRITMDTVVENAVQLSNHINDIVAAAVQEELIATNAVFRQALQSQNDLHLDQHNALSDRLDNVEVTLIEVKIAQHGLEQSVNTMRSSVAQHTSVLSTDRGQIKAFQDRLPELDGLSTRMSLFASDMEEISEGLGEQMTNLETELQDESRSFTVALKEVQDASLKQMSNVEATVHDLTEDFKTLQSSAKEYNDIMQTKVISLGVECKDDSRLLRGVVKRLDDRNDRLTASQHHAPQNASVGSSASATSRSLVHALPLTDNDNQTSSAPLGNTPQSPRASSSTAVIQRDLLPAVVSDPPHPIPETPARPSPNVADKPGSGFASTPSVRTTPSRFSPPADITTTTVVSLTSPIPPPQRSIFGSTQAPVNPFSPGAAPTPQAKRRTPADSAQPEQKLNAPGSLFGENATASGSTMSLRNAPFVDPRIPTGPKALTDSGRVLPNVPLHRTSMTLTNPSGRQGQLDKVHGAIRPLSPVSIGKMRPSAAAEVHSPQTPALLKAHSSAVEPAEMALQTSTEASVAVGISVAEATPMPRPIRAIGGNIRDQRNPYLDLPVTPQGRSKARRDQGSGRGGCGSVRGGGPSQDFRGKGKAKEITPLPSPKTMREQDDIEKKLGHVTNEEKTKALDALWESCTKTLEESRWAN